MDLFKGVRNAFCVLLDICMSSDRRLIVLIWVWQVLVWKVGCKADPDVIGSLTEDLLHLTSHEGRQLPYQQYEAVNICKLIGHEGSIFRLAWSADGFKLVSVSDDRRFIFFLINIYVYIDP